MNQGWLCSACGRSPAENFCYCNRAETLLCSSCHPSHFTKFPTRYHQNLPLSAFGHHRSPGYFERLQQRTEAVGKAKESLNQGLQAIDQCIEEFQGKVNQMHKSIWEYGVKVMNEVMRAKMELQEEINKSIEEVEAAMYEEQPQLQCKYSARMRNFNEANQFTLFQYSLNACEDVRSIIKFNWVFEEISHQIQPSKTSDSTLWTCICGYGYNQLDSVTCLNCKSQKPGVQVGLLEMNVPQPIAQEEVKRAPSTIPESTLWTCSCGHEYNLKTYEICAKCSLRNPFLPPKPQPQFQPPQKCTLCKTRSVNGSAQLCIICYTTKPTPKTSNDDYWVCINCERGYNQLGMPCSGCKKTREEVFPELNSSPVPKLPEGPLWNCNGCYRRNVITNQKCSGCGTSKPIFRCKEGCGTVVASPCDVCTDCFKKEEAMNQIILKGRDRVIAQYCPSCGAINCKEHAAGKVNPNRF